MNILARLWREEEGQDLIEYVLLVALIALGAAAAFPNVATAIDTELGKACTAWGGTC